MRELTTAICPECGADRNVVGTIAPLPPLRPNGWVIVAAWWIIAAVGLWLAWPIIQVLIPREVSYNEDYILMPHSGLYGPFKLRRIGYGTGWPRLGPWPKRVDAAVVFENTEKAFGGKFITDFTVYQHPQYATYATTQMERQGSHQVAARNTGGKPDADFFLQWMSEMQIDTSRADVRAEAEELCNFMTTLRFDPSVYSHLAQFTVQSMKSAKEAAPRPGYAPGFFIEIGVWLGVSLIGTTVILRRGRRRATSSSP